MKATQVSIERCTDKDVVYKYIYTHTNGILFSHKIEGNPAICDTDGP